jgi:hypothetical protein
MRQVTCMCETAFDADLPDEIDMDATSGVLNSVLSGDFFSVRCPNCGSTLKPELRVRLFSKKDKLDLVLIPELERMSLYLGKAGIPPGSEALVGYAELFERARILSDGLDPVSVEIMKYLMLEKAEEQAPNAELSAAYAGKKDGKLIFHISGLKEGQLAVLPIDPGTYERTFADKKRYLADAPFDRIFKGPYRSIRMLDAEGDEE